MTDTKPATLVFVMTDLLVGGAERVMVRLANFAASEGLDVHIVCLVGLGPLAAEVSAAVTVHNAGASHMRTSALRLRGLLAAQKPDVVIATLPPVNAITVLVARSLWRRPKVVIREANDPRHEDAYASKFHWLQELGLGFAYRRADQVIAVSAGVRAGLMEVFGVRPERIVALPNISLDDGVLEKAEQPLDNAWYLGLSKRVVCIARFSPQKDHSTLLRAFQKLEVEGAGLALIGYGPLEQQIRDEVEALGLEERVHLVVNEGNPYRWLRRADLLVLSSRWEGSPNVIVEALALGVPVVATDCPSGPREVLADGRFGKLVPVGDVERLAEAMAAALVAEHDHDALRVRSRVFHVRTVGPLLLGAIGAR